MNSRRRVLITTRLFDDGARALLRDNGCELVESGLPPDATDDTLPDDELVRLAQDADGWIIGIARLDDALLRQMPSLRIVARRGVGYDRVDIGAAKAHGVMVTVAPGGNEPSVADHTVALMLAAGSHLVASHVSLSAGDWRIQPRRELYRKTVGLIGCGRIGRQVVQRLHGFEVKVLVCDPVLAPGVAAAAGIELSDMDELLRRSDIVSLHLPLTDDTRRIIDAAAIAHMKPGTIVINTARGGLIDEEALLAALISGHLGGAGLDTFAAEGRTPLDATTQALMRHPGVVGTPHAGGSSSEGLERTNMIAAQCVLDVLDGRRPPAHCVVVEGRSEGRPADRRELA